MTSSGGAQAPRPFRAALASLLAAGGVLFVIGGASLALQSRKRSGASLSLVTEPLDSGVDSERRPNRRGTLRSPEPPFQQEEQP